jgi:hypothetical protein
VHTVNDASHFLLATINTTANTVSDLRRTNLTLAALRDEMAAARGNAAALPDRLNKTLAADGTMVPGTASIQKMASTLLLNAQVSVPAAPAVGQTAEQPITVLSTEDPAFLLVTCVSAASNAVAGRLDLAQRAISQAFERDPDLRAANLRDLFRRAEDFATLAKGLRDAGLPD